ncbi:MAG TPA: hypothetical protein DEG76_13460 [Pseudohongiella sp.]|nr:hypothetical protein [Pseudohongiella sp.]HBX38228.1 hypothetical protein [Pseudohongiella sp.]|tara:strand:- start:332 stop:820 length:489 start_codon:yes stop_codon:yes gene_type:complete
MKSTLVLFILMILSLSTKVYPADIGCENWLSLSPPSDHQVLNLCQINIEGEPIILGISKGEVDGFWSGDVYDSSLNLLGSPTYWDDMEDVYPQTVTGSNPELAWFYVVASTFALVWDTTNDTPYIWDEYCWSGVFTYQDIFEDWHYLSADNAFGCEYHEGFQ